MALRYPIARTVGRAVSSPEGYSPNLPYARRYLTHHEAYGPLWEARFALILSSEFATGSWTTYAGARRRWDQAICDGYVEIIPLADGTFRADVTYFKIMKRADDKRPDAEIIEEKINSPPLPRRAVLQKGLNFGLFVADGESLRSAMEVDDPDRPGFRIPDEG